MKSTFEEEWSDVMNVAVGRLQMSLTWTRRLDDRWSTAIARLERAERAHRCEQLAQQVEADRAGWRDRLRCTTPWL